MMEPLQCKVGFNLFLIFIDSYGLNKKVRPTFAYSLFLPCKVLNDHSIYWSDLGSCRHGQTYDSSAGRCRDVFCIEGYIFSSNGCVQDTNFNKTTWLNQVTERYFQYKDKLNIS